MQGITVAFDDSVDNKCQLRASGGELDIAGSGMIVHNMDTTFSWSGGAIFASVNGTTRLVGNHNGAKGTKNFGLKLMKQVLNPSPWPTKAALSKEKNSRVKETDGKKLESAPGQCGFGKNCRMKGKLHNEMWTHYRFCKFGARCSLLNNTQHCNNYEHMSETTPTETVSPNASTSASTSTAKTSQAPTPSTVE
jgi:hypothetical protein